MASSPTRGAVRVDRLLRRCETLKVGYASRELAATACEDQMRDGRVSPGCHLVPYECDRCREWHITNRRITGLPPADLSRRARRRE